MARPIIKTPRGKVFINDSSMKAELKWNSGFKAEWTGRYTAAQYYVDSEVLRHCEPFIPLRTGMLILSGILGTEVGSGVVQWIAPYARAQYYRTKKVIGVNPDTGKEEEGVIVPVGSETGPLRGPKWFERMKAVWGWIIIANARSIAGRGK